jgi:hypothetical protein
LETAPSARNGIPARPTRKFLSLDSMLQFKRDDAARMNSRIVNTHKIKVVGISMKPTRPPVRSLWNTPMRTVRRMPAPRPTGALASLPAFWCPRGYLRDLPAPLAADCIQWGLRYNRGKELVKVYDTAMVGDTAGEIRAATGPDYGRIFDWEIIKPIKDLVDASGGRWKVPGMMVGQRNGLAVYDPEIPVSMDTTTLFASDRDVFVFLVDDRNPIEIGKLANGEPDLVFRGFYAWNSETGSKTAGVAAMYLRGVCMNRNLWGVENFQEIKIRHTKFAPDRFAMEARPALQSFAQGATSTFLEGVKAAKEAIIAKDDDDRFDFLVKRAGLSQRMAKAAAARHLEEEGRPVESVWDAAQAITAIARDVPHQDQRIEVEKKAGALLDKVAA